MDKGLTDTNGTAVDTLTKPISDNPPPPKKRLWPAVLLFVVLLSLVAAGIWHLSRTPKIDFPNHERFVVLIYTDAFWFHENYMRWSVVDWALTAFAAGTAVSAAIKNAYSVKQDKQDASKLDIALMILAVLAVLATTFDAKLHAGQLAEQYRKGDLILQDAKMRFEKHIDDYDAQEKLLLEWQKAEDILESGTSTKKDTGQGQTPQGTPPVTPAAAADKSNNDPKTSQSQHGHNSPPPAARH
jgi:hypothetical protein